MTIVARALALRADTIVLGTRPSNCRPRSPARISDRQRLTLRSVRRADRPVEPS